MPFYSQMSEKDLKEYEESLTGSRTVFCKVFNSTRFDGAMCILIMANLILVVMDSDYRVSHNNVPLWLIIFQYAVITIFVLECSLRAYTYQAQFLRNPWNIMDVCILSIDVGVEIVSLLANGQLAFNFSVLRTLRLIRVLRALRFLGGSKELWMMLHGLGSAMKAIAWAGLLIALFLLVWAIVAVEILHPLNEVIAQTSNTYEDCARCPRAFASVGEALLTFIQQIIAGDSWGLTSLPLMEKHPWTSMIFLSVLVSVHLGLMNLVTAVIVDRAWEARQEDTQRQLQEKNEELENAKKFLNKFFVEMDEDASGTLSLDEILTGFDTNLDFRNAMKVIDISRDDIAIVFSMIDGDESGEVTFDEFVDGLTKMKSENAHTLLMFIKFYVQECRQTLTMQSKFLNGTLDTRTKLLEGRVADLWDLMVPGLPDSAPPSTHFNKYAAEAQSMETAAPQSKLGLVSSLDSIYKELGALRQQLDSELFEGLKASNKKAQQELNVMRDTAHPAMLHNDTKEAFSIPPRSEVLHKRKDYSAAPSSLRSSCCSPAGKGSPEVCGAPTAFSQQSSFGNRSLH